MKDNTYALADTQLINQKQLADLLGCSHRTISNMISRGEIPVIKVARLNRFQYEQVISALTKISK